MVKSMNISNNLSFNLCFQDICQAFILNKAEEE